MVNRGCSPGYGLNRRGIGLRRGSPATVRRSALTKNAGGFVVSSLFCLSTVRAAATDPYPPAAPPIAPLSRSSLLGSYLVSSDCPSQEQFVQEVLARCPVAAHENARAIVALSRISISASDVPTRGTLRLPSGEMREVRGTTCAEVVGALALVIALKARAVESTGHESGPSEADPSMQLSVSAASPTLATLSAEASSSDEPGGRSPATKPATGMAASSQGPAKAEAESGTSRRSVPMSARSSIQLSPHAFVVRAMPPSKGRWTLGAGASAAFGPAPVGLFGAALLAEYQSRAAMPHAVLLGAEAAPYATASIQAATARYQWWASHAAGCIQSLQFESSSALWLCAEVVGGVAIVTGQARGPITHARTANEAWLSAGPAARVRFQFADSYSLDLVASLGFPMLRHRTVFYEPHLVLHETGNLAGFLRVQLGRHSGG